MQPRGQSTMEYDLKDALVVQQPGPGHLGEVLNFTSDFLMTKCPYMLNFRFLLHPNDLEEAPVIL